MKLNTEKKIIILFLSIGCITYFLEYFEDVKMYINDVINEQKYDSNSNDATSSQDQEILTKMLVIYNKRAALLPKIEQSYNAYKAHLSAGYFYGTSPEWRRLIDYRAEIRDLCDEYIRLARQLSDNEEIVEEAERQKQGFMSAFDEMGLTPR